MTIRRRCAALLGAFLLALGGLGLLPAAPAAAKTSSGTTTTTVPKGKWDPRIEGIAKEVAKLRKLDFEHPVPVTFLTDKAFDKKVTVDQDKLSKKAKDAYAKSTARLAALALVPHGSNLVQQQNALQSSSVLAFYTPDEKKVYVRGKAIDTPNAKVTVAHELTHALQDQHFDLNKLEQQAEKSHSSDALRSLIEGDAVRVQKLYLDTLSDADQQTYASQNNSDVKQAQEQSDAANVPESMQVLLEAPYAFGDSMLQVVIAAGKEQALDGLFRKPPENDLAYLQPTTLVDSSKFTKVAAPAVDGKGEKQVGKPDTFGAFALYLVLAQQMPVADALRAADGWGGDAMVDYRKDGLSCVRTAFVGRTTDDTDQIGTGLRTWAAAQPAGSATVEDKDGKVLLSACDVDTARNPVQHDANEALVLAANRDGVLGTFMEQGAPRDTALCAADGVVRDAAFQPLLQQSAADPTAQPDAATLANLRTRVQEIVSSCIRTGKATGTA
jgi:hypothetical protein